MNLQQFRRRATRNKASLTAFLGKMDDKVPGDIQQLAAETDQTVWQDVDCLSCANCCKTMTPTWNRADISRTAKHLGMRPKDFVAQWLYQEEETGDWMNKSTPCQFLDLGTNKCTVYEVRPKDCREFPHHNKKPFDLYNDTFANNIMHCPATNLLITRLKKRIESEYEW